MGSADDKGRIEQSAVQSAVVIDNRAPAVTSEQSGSTPAAEMSTLAENSIACILQSVVASTEACLAYLDAEFRFVWVNDAYVRTSGHTEAELIGRNHFDLFPNAENESIFRRVRDSGTVYSTKDKAFVYRSQPERGVTYWDWTLTPIKDDSGDVEGLVLSLVDVTERNRADHALRMSNEKFQAIFDNANDALLLNQVDEAGQLGGFIEVNRVACEELVYSREELLQMSPLDIVEQEFHEAIPAIVGRLLSEGRDRFELVVASRDGRRIPVEINAHLFELDGRRVILSVARDITDRKQMEESILRAGAANRALLRGMPDLVFRLDQDGRVLAVNREGNRPTPIPAENMIGRRIDDFLPENMSQLGLDAVKNALATGEVVTAEFSAEMAGGRRYFESRVVRLSDHEVIAMLRDISKRKTAEMSLERAKRAAERTAVRRGKHLDRMNSLLRVSIDVLAADTAESLLQTVVDAVCEVTDAELGAAGRICPDGALCIEASSCCRRSQSQAGIELRLEGRDVCRKVIESSTPVGLTKREFVASAASLGLPEDHPSLKGLVAVPIIRRDGASSGLVMASSRTHGEFTAEDEAVLSQLAMIASLGLHHLDARQDAERRAAHLESFVSGMADGLSIIDAEGKVIFVNDAGREILGTPDGDPNGWVAACRLCDIEGTILPEGSTASDRALQGEILRDERYLFRNPEGKLTPVSTSGAPIRDTQGRVIGATHVFRDDSKRIEYERVKEELYQRERWIANTLQSALLPTIEADLPGYGIAAGYQPACTNAQVGGDFFDVFNVGIDRVALVMADVSGKGIRAAVHTAMAKYMLRAFAGEDPAPGQVLTRLNDAVCCHGAGVFISVFYGVLDTVDHTLIYANAGHDEPLLFSCEMGCPVALDVTGRAVGILAGSTYGERRHPISSGDVLLVYTDGITEARNARGFFGIDGLEKVLAASASDREQSIVDAVFGAASEAANGDLHDDAAVVVLKRN